MKTRWRLAAWALAIQGLLIVPFFLGEAYRGERSLAAWREYGSVRARWGQGTALFSAYLYLVFYVSLVALFSWLLGIRYSGAPPESKGFFAAGSLLAGFWLAVTFLLFSRSIGAFFHSLPYEAWHGWLLLLWLCSAGLFVLLVVVLERRLKEMGNR